MLKKIIRKALHVNVPAGSASTSPKSSPASSPASSPKSSPACSPSGSPFISPMTYYSPLVHHSASSSPSTPTPLRAVEEVLLEAVYRSNQPSYFSHLNLNNTVPVALASSMLDSDKSSNLEECPFVSLNSGSESIQRFLKITTDANILNEEVLLYAVALIEKLQATKDYPVCPENIHHLFFVACSLGSKMLRDQSRSQTITRNTQFAFAAGFDDVAEFGDLEFCFWSLLDYNAHVDLATFMSSSSRLITFLEKKKLIKPASYPALTTPILSVS